MKYKLVKVYLIKLKVINSDDLSLSIIHICSLLLVSCFVVQKQHQKHYFWLILRLTGGPYLGRFGVRPANVGPGRSLGLRPGWAGPASCRILGRPVRTAFDILPGSRTRGDHNPRVLSTTTIRQFLIIYV